MKKLRVNRGDGKDLDIRNQIEEMVKESTLDLDPHEKPYNDFDMNLAKSFNAFGSKNHSLDVGRVDEMPVIDGIKDRR